MNSSSTSACTSTNVRTLGFFGRCFCCWEDADGCLVRLSVRPLSVRPRARCSLRLSLERPLVLLRSVRTDSGCFAGLSLLEVLEDLCLSCCGECNSDVSPHFGRETNAGQWSTCRVLVLLYYLLVGTRCSPVPTARGGAKRLQCGHA